MNAIHAEGLRLSYGNHLVLDGLDLAVPTGTVTALLGPNGAGKTSTVHLLTTLRRPDAGTARVAGHDVLADPAAVRRAIGVTGQFSAVDELLTGAENLRLMTRLHHLARAEAARTVTDLLDRMDLVEAADRTVATWSGGMRRKLDLAMTLVGRPRVIFLDEPTTGLDPRSRREVWAIVADHVADGTTVLLTTQYLEEADRLADQVVVLHEGRVAATGTPAQLKASVPGGRVRLRFASPEVAADGAARLPDATLDRDAMTVEVPHDGGVAALRHLLDTLDQAALTPEDLTVHTADLDDVFLTLTAGTTPDAGTTATGGPR